MLHKLRCFFLLTCCPYFMKSMLQRSDIDSFVHCQLWRIRFSRKYTLEHIPPVPRTFSWIQVVIRKVHVHFILKRDVGSRYHCRSLYRLRAPKEFELVWLNVCCSILQVVTYGIKVAIQCKQYRYEITHLAFVFAVGRMGRYISFHAILQKDMTSVGKC